MLMDSKTLEIMNKIVEDKKKKSASQKGFQRGPEVLGGVLPGKKKNKKTGGVFDK